MPDHRNRLVEFRYTAGGGTWQKINYTYDVFNRLIARTFDEDGDGSATPTTQYYSYDDGQIVLQFEGAQASTLSHRYLWNPEAVDHILAQEEVSSLTSPGYLEFALTDRLGSFHRFASDDGGDTVLGDMQWYDAWGPQFAPDMLFNYTGRYFDQVHSLQYNLNRWYNPSLGRWMSEDPIGFAAGDTNLYRYVANDPIRHVDASGLSIWNPWSWWKYWRTGNSAMNLYDCCTFGKLFTDLEKQCELETADFNGIARWSEKCPDQISPIVNKSSVRHAQLCCILHKAKDDPNIDFEAFTNGFVACAKALRLPIDVVSIVLPPPFTK
jgi:RHS repeat-associated protein